MKPTSCPCTLERPGCEQGQRLFTATEQVLPRVGLFSSEDQPWISYHLARLAYLDHLSGWQEGDVKVRREAGSWMAYTRSPGEWVRWFGTGDEQELQAHLQASGYVRSSLHASSHPMTQHLGYYRKQEAVDTTRLPIVVSAPRQEAVVPASEQSVAEQAILAESGPPTSLDLKTQVTLLIGLLVAQFPHPLTVVDRLRVQQRVAQRLRSGGMHLGPGEERAIVALIDGAIQQKGMLSTVFS